ncbi:hypothetical protein HDV01_004011 [Terramyces sp. JEL0728]|nr:hypothetical protein HDV01_004011 [Terramyces sp. JEL0728]
MNDDVDTFFEDSPQGRVRVYPHYPQRPVARYGEQEMIVPMPIYNDQYYEPMPVVVDPYDNQYREEPLIYNEYDNRIMDSRLMTPRYRKLSKKVIPSSEPRRVFAPPLVHAPIYPQSATKSSRYSMAYDLDDYDTPYRRRKIKDKFKEREDSDDYISDQENRRHLNYDSDNGQRKVEKKKKVKPETDSEAEKPVKPGKKRGRKSMKEKLELQKLEASMKEFSDDSVALSDDEHSISDVKLTQSTSSSETPRSPAIDKSELKKSKEKVKPNDPAKKSETKRPKGADEASKKEKRIDKPVEDKIDKVPVVDEEDAIPIRKRFGMTPRSVQRKQKEELIKILDKPIEPLHFLKNPVNLKPVAATKPVVNTKQDAYPRPSTPVRISEIPPVPESVEKIPSKSTDEAAASQSPILRSNALPSSPIMNDYIDFNNDYDDGYQSPSESVDKLDEQPAFDDESPNAAEHSLAKVKKSLKKKEKGVKEEINDENGSVPKLVKKKRGRPAKMEKDTNALENNSDSEPVVKKPKIKVKREPLAYIEKQVERPNISESDDGLRKSKRTKVPPLAFWRNEKVIYGRRDSGIGPVVTSIQEVLRVPSDDESIPVRRTKTKNRIRVKKEYEESEIAPEPVPSEIEVMNYVNKQFEFQSNNDLTKEIAVTPNMLETHKSIGSGDYRFQKVFSEGDFIASGVLEISKGAEKPNKNSHASAMIFVVLVGHIQVTVNKTAFNLSRNGQFFVPRGIHHLTLGNQYSIKNVGQSEAKIFFCHGKLVPA